MSILLVIGQNAYLYNVATNSEITISIVKSIWLSRLSDIRKKCIIYICNAFSVFNYNCVIIPCLNALGLRIKQT